MCGRKPRLRRVGRRDAAGVSERPGRLRRFAGTSHSRMDADGPLGPSPLPLPARRDGWAFRRTVGREAAGGAVSSRRARPRRDAGRRSRDTSAGMVRGKDPKPPLPSTSMEVPTARYMPARSSQDFDVGILQGAEWRKRRVIAPQTAFAASRGPEGSSRFRLDTFSAEPCHWRCHGSAPLHRRFRDGSYLLHRRSDIPGRREMLLQGCRSP